MTVLFDTDILIDFLLDREPHAEAAARLLSAVERGALRGSVCATSVTTVFYLARKAVGAPRARRQVELLLSLVDVSPVNRSVLESALASRIVDFEDAVVAHAAAHAAIDLIVTRNQKDFKHSPVPVQAPADLLALLSSRDEPAPDQ